MKNSRKIAVIVLTLLLSACSETKTAQELLVSGNNFVQARDFSSAVIEFKNAIRLEPNNANARLMLAKVYVEQGSYLNADKELSRALDLGIAFADVAILMVKVNTHLDKFDEVYLLAEQGNSLADDEYIQILTYAGISALKQQQQTQGQDFLTQAIAIDNTAAFSQVAQAYLHYSNQEFSQGLEVINHLLLEHKSMTEALLVQGYLYYALKEFTFASDTFAHYLTFHPDAYNVRFLEIDSLIKAENFEQANVLTETLLKVFKNSPLALQFKAQLEYQKESYSEARRYAREAQQYGESLLLAQIISGVSSYFLGDIEQAYTQLSIIAERVPDNSFVKKILAITKLELGYYSDAANSFSMIENLSKEDLILLKNSSMSLIAAGELSSALIIMKKAEKLAPDNAELIAQKGLILLSQNDASGFNDLEKAVKLEPQLVNAQLALAFEYLKRGQEDKTKDIMEKYLLSEENRHIGYLLEGAMHLQNKKVELAQLSFEKALTEQPDNIASLYNLGLLHQDRNEGLQAITYFDQVLKLVPEHKGALKSLVEIAKNGEFFPKVYAALSMNSKEGNYWKTIALAQALRVSGQVNDAITQLKALAQSEKLTANYFILLGDCYLELSQYEKANITFAQGLTLEPTHYFLNIRYISTLEWFGRYAQALEQARKLHEFYNDNASITASLAYFEVKNKNYQEAKKLISILEKDQISHYLIDVIMGEVYSVEKNYEQAIESFSAAYEKQETEVNLLNLARTLKFNQQKDSAEKLLEKYIEKHPDNSKIRLLLTDLYGNEQRDKKINQYLALSTLLPNSEAVFNNLAWNQYKIGRYAQALDSIKIAYRIKPDSLPILESYGVILAKNNILDESLVMLKKAIDAGSTDSEVNESWYKVKSLLNNN